MKKTHKGEKRSRIYKCHRDKERATTTPVASVSDLKGPWCRVCACYTLQVVRVTALRGDKLSFQLVDVQAEVAMAARAPPKTYSVDLDDGDMVWGDLPSTAQLVDPKSKKTIAYLGLTEKWFQRNAPKRIELRAMKADDGPKWPDSCSL